MTMSNTVMGNGDAVPDTARKILVLPPEEARKIAAGEVIDRPAALVREFLDNAIDSDAGAIEVFIEDGGILLTEVVDDGGGMGREDLETCHLTHATSKIRSLDDLKTARTLGFRGEALAAAAAVSRLEIVTSTDGREAWKLSAGPGSKNHGGNSPGENSGSSAEQYRRTRGTTVRAMGLYDTIPARKKFLKRSGSEAAACRQIYNEKALAFPEIAFRFTQDGVLKSFLPSATSLKERFSQIFLEEREKHFLHEIAANGSGFSVSVIAGGPELTRTDRRLQYVFANNRRIQDFSLLQALEYGLQGWFPNGNHPVGAVFVTVDPALADFNIHPAKREVRFADGGAIHHAVSSALKNFCRAALLQNPARHAVNTPKENIGDKPSGQLAMEALLSDPPVFAPLPGREKTYPDLVKNFNVQEVNFTAEKAELYTPDGRARYLGRLFGLFILIEKGDRFFIIDQHAAHERILYEKFINNPIPKQELLVPLPFTTESPRDDEYLEGKVEELTGLGIDLKRGDGEWLITALPLGWKLSDRETLDEIMNLKTAGENLAEHWAATLSCRNAVKEGDYLDAQTALALAEEAFSLPVHRCPHGRPIWYEISQKELFQAVKRE